VAPVTPVDQQRFVDDFASMTDGWVPAGQVTRLEKRRDALVVQVNREGGRISRPVTWDLPAGGTLVLEYATTDLDHVRLQLDGDSVITLPVKAGGELATARFLPVPLPPGRYRAFTLELAPIPGLTRTDPKTGLTQLRGGRLDLRGYLVLPSPAPSMATR
jgi:hypothetical protein